ncbi:SDR family oxidoreductase [Candidatus Sumerlaeota bacterium]|nr:SDR family oxidoreductase [Candidatus Sumerlaeota bacterium]
MASNHTSQSLAGEVALVTGAGKRIGRAIALELASAGARIIVHVNGSQLEGRETVSQITASGGSAAFLQADQRDAAAIERACENATTFFGPVTILVNSAAIWPKVALEHTTLEDFDNALETNLRGPFFWARHLGLRMKAQGRGCIVNIADVTFDRPRVECIPYEISKAGIVSMTYGLAKALAPSVRVNCVAPGPIDFPVNYSSEAAGKDVRATLLGRRGEARNIAHAVRFFCENDYTTGAVLPIDGGYRFGI